MTGENHQRHEMLCRIRVLLQTLPDEIVEALVKQWEAELEALDNHDKSSSNPDTAHESSDNGT